MKSIETLIMGVSVVVLCLFTSVSLAISAVNVSAKDSKVGTINKIMEVYKSHPSIKSEFIQEDKTGKSTGWFVLDRSNQRARIQYKDKPLRVIINNKSIMMEQTDLEEKTFAPIFNSPLRYIVDGDSVFNNPHINISEVKPYNQGYTMQIQSKDGSFHEVIVLRFDKKFYLQGWVIIDQLGDKTTVNLVKPSYITKPLPDSIFNTHRVQDINFAQIK